MKTIKSALFGFIALMALTSTSSSFSLNGVYLEAGTSAVGVALDGNHVNADAGTTVGTVGKTAVTASYGLGYMLNKSGKLGLDIGYFVTPGEAKISGTSDSATSDVTFEVSDSKEYYIAPMLNITDDASVYIKFGKADADIKVTGDVTKPTSMDGNTLALGTVMSWGSNLFIRTEAGMTEYDKLTVTGLGAVGGTPLTTTINATPDVHYGKIAIGYKF